MNDKMLKREYWEEVANSITHGIGVLLSVVGLVLLIIVASLYGNAWHIVSFSIFGTALVVLYSASTLYHSARDPKLKIKLNKFDHASIYILIAGTYTPFTLVTLNGAWGWTIFGIQWGLAITGVVYKIWFYNEKYRVLSAVLYLAMGWMLVVGLDPLLANLSEGGLLWLFIGGLFYSLGVIFYIFKKVPFFHTIWHLFVLGGSISHFFAIFYYVR